MSQALHHLTLLEAARRLADRETSSLELTRAVLDRIDAVEPSVRAYLHVEREGALAQARESDRRRAAGQARGPLDGVPMALKDNLCTRGMRTTCASRILANFVPPYSATVANRLAEAGAVLVGKANMDEFAMGSSVENSGFYHTYNPWDLQRVPGGSSGGSAAAVAAGEALFALGSDTGGSIRQPASLCGITGLKPTYGRVSRYGLVAFASSLDQIGPMTRDAADCAAVLQVIAGHDPLDSTSAEMPVPDFVGSLGDAQPGALRGLRIGVPREYFGQGLEPAVDAAVRAAIEKLVELGCVAEEISLPHTDYGLSAYYIIAPAEASSNLARYDGVRYGVRAEGGKDLIDLYSRTRAAGFGPEVKRRIMLGTYVLSSGYYEAYYGKALKVRTLIRQDFDRAWERCDLIACPTSPVVAFRVGERAADPLQMYLADVLTVPVNLAGVPGLSVPCGFAPAPAAAGPALPIGLQLVGKPFDEATLLRVAHAYQQATDHHRKRPPLAGAAAPNMAAPAATEVRR